MSKKIDRALSDLCAALRKHAEAVGASHVSLKKAERTVVKLQAAAGAYAAAVQAKTGMDNPFSELPLKGIDGDTLQSLAAERDALFQRTTGPIATQVLVE